MGRTDRQPAETLTSIATAPFEYVFPAIRGIQAKREYYVSMCPMRLIPKIFLFDEEELVPELRAQRTLNKGRIPEIARYIVDNRTNYTFSALTASIDGNVRFESIGTGADGKRVGVLHVAMDARFVINDGQHRRAAIEVAMREHPELADESIAIVLFLDVGLQRCQQMFADLNRHAIRPSRSLGVLYDHRDEMAKLAKLVVLRSPLFKEVVEMASSTLSARSRKLFTLSALYTATSALLAGMRDGDHAPRTERAFEFWTETTSLFPEWQLVKERKITSADLRRDYLHSHGIALHALGNLGCALGTGAKWRQRLRRVADIDWSRSNAKLWEGRAMIGGRVSKAGHNVILTTNVLKRAVGVALSPEDQRVEDAFLRGDHAVA